MPSITSSNLANAIVKLVAADALPALMGNLVMGNLVNRDFEPTLAKAGDTVNVPVPPSLTANNLAEGGTVVTQNPNVGNAQIVAVPDLLKLYMEPAVIALAEKVETDLLALATSFTANPALGSGGVAVTEDVIDQAETALFNAKVPSSMPKHLVVDAATYSALRLNPRFSEYSRAGDAGLKALIDGNIGRLKDFFVFRSQFVRKNGTPLTTRNLAFAKNAIGLAIRRLPQPLPGTGAIAEYAELGNFGVRVVMSYQPDTLAQQFTVDILYGAAILRNNHGVLINS
jgi:hypothetical protein